ncbi:MAG: phasin [Xanthobacteraceae bacterium]
MSETVKKAAKLAPKFEAPMFDPTKFGPTKIEMPEMFRDMAEKGVEQAKESYARMRTAAEETTDLVEDTYLTATRGATEFSLKAIEALRANVNSSFDFARQLLAAKSPSEAVELSSMHMREQFDVLSAQAKDFSALAQKVATETAEPMKSSVNKTFKTN